MMRKTACHHGASHRPNHLSSACEVLRKHPEIEIVEIDFVTVSGVVLSAHDYSDESIDQGSPLSEWVEQVVISQRRILWLDLKENLSLLSTPFDCTLLSTTLTQLFTQHKGDLQHRLLLSSQSVELANRLHPIRREGWSLLMDVPSAMHYVRDYLPLCTQEFINQAALEQLRDIDLRREMWLAVDVSFFASVESLSAVLRSNTTLSPANTRIILYTAPQPLTVDGYRVTTMLDY
jgi:hypothetical protein